MRTKINYSKTLKLASVFSSLRHCKTALLAVCMIFSVSTVAANAQSSIAVHGNVTDASKAPIPGATVVIKGTTTGIITDGDGKYSLDEVPKDAVLVFSFMGMASQEIPVSGQRVINVALQDANIKLDEVVAIGYGTQTKKQVSGSIASVSSGDFNKGVVSSAADLLKGKVAGLAITQPGGDVTQKSTIRLRGTTSISAGNDPLVVIDGIPGLTMTTVAPEDIATISVLKDASASAIYGSRGANGVIMITTRKGQASRTQVDYSTYVAVSTAAHIPDMLNGDQFRALIKSSGMTNFEDNGANTNWYKAISRTAISQEHNLTLSGGAADHNYIATINYQNNEGVIIGNQSQRLNARFSFTQRAINNRLKMTFTGMSSMKQWSPAADGAFTNAKKMPATDPIKNADGSYYLPSNNQLDNPVAMVTADQNDHESNFNLVNGNTSFEILPGLKYNLNLSRSMEKETVGTYTSSETNAGVGVGGIAYRGAISNNRNILETNLSYDKSFKNQHINAMAGYSYEYKEWDEFYAQNRGFVTEAFSYNNLVAGNGLKPSDVSSYKNMSILIGMYTRVQYDLDQKYFLTATIRRDGSSKFGANNKWGYFPSASAAWQMSDENFMKQATWINELKLRVGYGASGNQAIDPYKSLATYGSTGTYVDGTGKIVSGYGPTQNPNPNLKWETTTQFNAGIDYSFFKDRLYGSLEYYDKRTTNLLYKYTVPVPPYIYNNIMANVGSMKNVGFEAMFNVDVIKNKAFKWTTSLNISSNKNEITSLSDSQFQLPYQTQNAGYIPGGSNGGAILEPGHPVGEFFGFKYAGLDANGKWLVTQQSTGKTIALADASAGYGNDYTYLGSPFPKFTWGFNNTFTYKNLDVTVFFRGSQGNKVMNLAKVYFGNKVAFPGVNIYASAVNDPVNDKDLLSSYYIEDGSFARLENLTIGYTLNTNSISWMSKLRIYFTGQNLLTITKYSGTDPEVPMEAQDPNNVETTTAPGVEQMNFYPKTRIFTFGLNASF